MHIFIDDIRIEGDLNEVLTVLEALGKTVTPPDPVVVNGVVVPAKTMRIVRENLRLGRKIQAIKELRAGATNGERTCSLLEAKNFVDQMESTL